jgi:cytochrome c oxidase subunit 2
LIVLGLFIFGTYELAWTGKAGAGGGEGPDPVWVPADHKVLTIQVIAQQWEFTYRYPTFGGFETSELVIPADTTIAFHVTSLDVIHSFWAYQLGVKADANPEYDNVAYTQTTNHLGQFSVRCSELCGLWHGAMFDTGKVVSVPKFMVWAKTTEKDLAPATKLLPPFAWTYTPDANGADGGYYPDDRDPYSGIEVYGAQKVKP